MKKRKVNVLKKILIALAVTSFLGAATVAMTACKKGNNPDSSSVVVDD